jgi:RimJ/RimL family protein N-acetyltransferase
MGSPPVLVTDRLRIRMLEERDLHLFAERADAPEVYATTLRMPRPYTVDDARAFMGAQHTAWAAQVGLVLTVCLRDTDEPIGSIGIEINRGMDRAELGYWIAVPMWGQGYATEAAGAMVGYGFERLGLHRVYAGHFSGNEASGRVLTKVGMSLEGTLRECLKKDGAYRDDVVYGVLKREFEPCTAWAVEGESRAGA